MSEGKSYRILGTVASGGTAVLYRALQISLDRVVAVKRLHQHLTQDENFTRRFVLEAKAAASLDHQNIVRVIDFGIEEGSYQMVMEYVEGESLKEVLDRWRPLRADLSLALVHQVCRGLEHAHAKGIVHRDIKPGNIMLTRAGVAKITDFGLAKLTQGNNVQTAAETILGTPLYMSPEQAFGESVDQRSDLFSLGTVLYELLTGRQPFASENYMGVIQNIIHREIPAVRDLNEEVAPEVEAIVMRALAKDREARFSSAREFREAIEQAMGLDNLMRATASLPALLDHAAATRVLAKAEVTPKPGAKNAKRAANSGTWSTVSAVKKRHARPGPPVWVTAPVIAVALVGAATWFFWPRLRGEHTATTTEVQQASLGDLGGLGDPAVPVDSAAADSSSAPMPALADTVANTKPDAGAPEPKPEPAKAAPETTAVAAKTKDEPPAPAPETTPVAAPVAKPAPRVEPDKPFREGFLLVNADPSAGVYINGIYRGTAAPTLRLTLPAGLFSLECRADDHDSYLESIRIVPGELSQRTIELKKMVGVISLATTEGAELYVDGKLIGITPVMRPIEVAAGVHTVTIKKDRYFTWSSDVMVEANATLPLHITLSPRY
ncbi:MAG TPA: protein kinase [Candidatus Krumholzibacteria bacterium]